MAFNRGKAYEFDNGYIGDGGVWFTSGTATPSHSAATGDKYSKTDGTEWVYNGTIWVQIGGLSASAEGTNNLFSSEGTNISTAGYSVIGYGSTSDSTQNVSFISVAEDCMVRLYDLDSAIQLAELNFSADSVPTRREVTFTLPGAEHIVEVQAKKDGSSGRVYMAEIR